MSAIATVLEIAGSIAILVMPPILVVRLLAGRGGGSLADLFATRADLPRPRGVQEDDLPAWRFEHVAVRSRRTPSRADGVATCGARPARAHAAGARS